MSPKRFYLNKKKEIEKTNLMTKCMTTQGGLKQFNQEPINHEKYNELYFLSLNHLLYNAEHMSTPLTKNISSNRN